MKKYIIFFLLIFAAHLVNSQGNGWTPVKAPTDESLKTVAIDKNGDIYVFGDKAFGAVSSDNGLTWREIKNFSYLGIDITSCLIDDEKVFIANKDRVLWDLKDELGDNELSIGIHYVHGELGEVEKIQYSEKGVKVFSRNTGLSFNLEPHIVEISGSSYSSLFPYNFYLPLNSFAAKYKRANYWKTRVANNGRMISVFSGSQNVWEKIFLSDDEGRSWREIKTEIDNGWLTFVLDIVFSGDHGFMVLVHYGGSSFFLYETKNNGEHWSYVGQYANREQGDPIYRYSVFKSIFNDNGIPVSVGDFRHDRYQNEDRSLTPLAGYIQHGEKLDTVKMPLHYVTGSENKLVAVGDSGWVYIYKKGSTTGQIIKSGSLPSLKIYPNPTRETLYFHSQEKGKLKIVNTLGEIVLAASYDPGKTEIKIKNLKPGVYFLNTALGSEKFVVM